MAIAATATAQVNPEPYQVTTFAGVLKRSGVLDGVGTRPPVLRGPAGIALDGTGTIYFSEFGHTVRKISPDGTITTIAGADGEAGMSNGVGAAARFKSPYGLARDAHGNLFVADQVNHAIRKITPEGVVTTFAGLPGTSGSTDGLGTAARFYRPSGLALDAMNNLYVADKNNHILRKISPTGIVSTFAGLAGAAGSADGAGSVARFHNPAGVALDGSGNLYVSDSGNHSIRMVTPAGVVTTVAGKPFAPGSADGVGTAARFRVPAGVVVDGNGNVYVSDGANHTIRKIAPGGVVTTLAGAPGAAGAADGVSSSARFNRPAELALDSSGNLYVSDMHNHMVRRITSAGVVSAVAGQPGFFSLIKGMAADASGSLYVADSASATIRKITPAGAISTLAGAPLLHGSADGNGANARFTSPSGVAVDRSGNVYVADNENCTIRKITPAGDVTTIAGDPGDAGYVDGAASASRFNYPSSVAVDSAGNVFVADPHNHAIRKITPAGVVTTLLNNTTANLSRPASVAIDSADNLYVTDANAVVRKITPNGTATILAGSIGVFGAKDGTGTAATFQRLTAMTVDAFGNVFVADTFNNNIRKITPQGVVTTLAGGVMEPGTTDGRGTAARFDQPEGIAVNAAGDLYIGDTWNGVVRRATPFAAVSRKLHAGTVFDVDLPLTLRPVGVECRTGGANGNYQIALLAHLPSTFSSVSVTSGSGIVATTSGNGTATLIAELAGVANAQTLSVTFHGVNDGNSLRDLVVPVSILAGDSTGDGAVNAGDLMQTRSRSAQPLDATTFRSDINADGAINSGDAMTVRTRSGTALESQANP